MGDKKRKLAETPAEEPVAPDVKKAKKEKKEKKEKRKADDVTEEAPHPETAPKSYEKWKQEKKEKKERKKEEKKEKARRKQEKAELDEEAKKAKKERKDRKYNKNKKPSQSTEEKTQAPKEEEANGDAQPSNDAEEGAAEEGAAAEGKNARFICFVGNLPYSANTESVQKHFEKNPPALVRVATQKEKPTKCRGFAFIEFDNFDRMKSCLKLYHHSTFDDGKYPPRAINVELTAGGGGNTDYRKGKIEAKNKKLYEERQRNAKQIQKDKKKHDKSGQKGANAPTGANAVGMDGANDEDDKYAGVHPSRRPRMW